MGAGSASASCSVLHSVWVCRVGGLDSLRSRHLNICRLPIVALMRITQQTKRTLKDAKGSILRVQCATAEHHNLTIWIHPVLALALALSLNIQVRHIRIETETKAATLHRSIDL
ncbi:uncharacterized protein LOC122322822 [Drosophila grimshawi]|uniref:uncharacterized protein LOC122322822 n=1 Tax=Drosophila grimshawi TaxID=7222 RepID=UPI001C933BCC|nr:uncharacterized protein LOC122322822 [Drosophila grimshawi]